MRARIQKVLDWALPLATLDEPHQLNALELTEVFGNQTSNALSRVLRATVLERIGFFGVDDEALSYVVRRDGIEALMRALDDTSRTSK